MSGALEITVLGCGSSGGVPRADGNWGLCDPSNPKNARTRCSALVRRKAQIPGEDETTVLVDTSPDFRTQGAAIGLQRLDAVLYTHDHADQTHGIDDLRAIALRMHRRVPCFMDPATHDALIQRFSYIFNGEHGYPAICHAERLPPHGSPWSVEGPSGAVPVVTFDQEHGPIRSVGYRFGGVAYSSDVSDLPGDAIDALQGLDLWIVDALRWTPHPTHADVGKALHWIAELKPAQAVLTNLHVDLDYAELARQLPSHVAPAYDGMSLTLPLDD